MYEEKNGTKTRPATQGSTRIVATYEMDQETFVRHMNARHKESLRPADRLLADRMDYNTLQLYLAYHRRLHLEQLGHYHDADPPEAAIDRAIELIIQNRDWGWKEIADVYGFVAAFPEGQLATKVDGVILYHGDISEATDRLVEAGRLARENVKNAAKAKNGKR